MHTGIAFYILKYHVLHEFELNQWSASKIQLFLSNASVATFLEYRTRSLRVKAVSPKHNSDKMLYLWMNLKSCLIKIQKMTSLEYESVICVLIKILES